MNTEAGGGGAAGWLGERAAWWAPQLTASERRSLGAPGEGGPPGGDTHADGAESKECHV